MLADNDYPSNSLVEMNSENENSNKGKKRNSRTIFGSYQLLRTIGEGEFGKVKLGIKLNTQSAVAIKLIKKKSVYNQNKLTKLCQEISILEKVNHPYIIKTYEVIENNDYIGIIMEYASGGELFEYILAHRYLEEYEAKRFFAQLLSGINYLHKNHLVHRDLKLENLLLDSIHNIVITDFGFATVSHSDENKLLTTSCGSPCYAAPELVVNDGYVGESADIWSCGVILYAMICGYLPFDDDPDNPDGENIHLLYKYILETEVTFPDYVSEEAKDLLRGILNPDPELRFTMEQIINHPWIREFKEFILIEYDENNEAIIPTYDEMPEEMRQMNDNNQNNIKTLASQVFSSTSSITQHELNNSSSSLNVDNSVPDINSNQSYDEDDESYDDDDDDDEDDEDDDDDDDDDDDNEIDDEDEEDENNIIDETESEDGIESEDEDEDEEDDDDDRSRKEESEENYFIDSKNNILPDVSTIDSDQYIDFIKQSDCDTTTSNIVNSETSELIRPTIFKKDSYYTAQSMDLNHSSVTTNDTENDDDEELNLPTNISIPMNTRPNFNDTITIPDSTSNYYTDHSEVYSSHLDIQPNKQTFSSENDENNYLEESNKTITDLKKITEEKENQNQKLDTMLSNSIDQSFSPIYSSILENSIEEISLSVNNQSNTLVTKPKPRNSSLPINNNLLMSKIESLNTIDDKESSIFSQTVVEIPTTKSTENPENTSTIIDIEEKEKEEEKKEEIKEEKKEEKKEELKEEKKEELKEEKKEELKEEKKEEKKKEKEKKEEKDNTSETQCLSKLENLSLDTSKDFSVLKDDSKSIRSDRKSIRSKTDLSLMKLENIKLSRSNISLSSRKRLSICTTSSINTYSSTPFYTPSSGKRLSSTNLSINDISMDSLHPKVGHTSLIIPPIDSSSFEMKRYSLNAYKQSRNNLIHPSTSMISARSNNTSKKSKIIQNSLYENSKLNLVENYMDMDPSSNLNSIIKKETQGPIMILDELKEDKKLFKNKPLNESIVHQSDTNLNNNHHNTHPMETDSYLNNLQSKNTEAVTEMISNEITTTEPKVRIEEETALIESNKPSTPTPTQVKPIERELLSPKNPYIKYFKGIIDSKALTVTPPFVTFLEMQKTLIDMDIDYRVLNNCFKIRCQKVFNTIASPEDLEALGKASPAMSPLHSPASTPIPYSPSLTPSSSPHHNGKARTINKSKKSIMSDVVTTSSPKIKSKENENENDDNKVSKCYSFHSHGSRKFKSLMNSIIDCAKPSLPTPLHSPTSNNRRRTGSDIRQKSIFNLIKRKKNQSQVVFTMEICRIKNRDELYVIKFKRQKGDVWLFKDLYQQILSRLPLRT